MESALARHPGTNTDTAKCPRGYGLKLDSGAVWEIDEEDAVLESRGAEKAVSLGISIRTRIGSRIYRQAIPRHQPL